MAIFTSTLNQLMFLFSLILTGYYLAKKKHIPQNLAMVLSRLENMLFIPGLVMGTFIENFTVERISSAWKILLVSFIMI